MDDATISELKNKVHAVLFSAGRAVDCEELGKLVHAPEQLVREAVRELKKQLEESQSPLLLTEESNGNAWKLTVRDRYVEVVKDVTPHTELEVPVLATLALIAWKQPMLQSEVIKRRSTVAYEHIAKLEELGFVSKEKKGRSFLLKPTGKFFDYFDLPSQEAVKKLFEEIEPRVQKIQQMSEELAKEQEPKKVSKKLGGLDVYEPPAGEEKPEKKEEEEAEDKEETENEDISEEDEEKEKKVIDELFEEDDQTKKNDEEEREDEEQTKEDEEGEEKEETDSDEEAEEEKPKKQDKGKRKLPKELEDFAGKEEKIGEE